MARGFPVGSDTTPAERPTEYPTDAAAFVCEVTANQRRLYAFILSLVRIPNDADDVLQETNLVLWQKASEFTPGTNFTAWAFSIARFQVMAFRKRQKRSRESFDDTLIELLADDAEAHIDESDARRAALRGCIRKLRPEHAALIAERYEPGACVNEIARRAGKSPKALSEQLARVRTILLKCVTRTLAAEDRS
ncbi:MAG: RNA polymerase subunit sigma-70 [Planctomycetaceae bacterium]|nr:RNA polymerase subunit sigma-70 [Planctomycetaceae bacterium]